MDRYTARIQIEATLIGILYHDDLIDEILDLVIGSGIEKQFFKEFVANIDMLKFLGANAIETKNFEKLKMRMIYIL